MRRAPPQLAFPLPRTRLRRAQTTTPRRECLMTLRHAYLSRAGLAWVQRTSAGPARWPAIQKWSIHGSRTCHVRARPTWRPRPILTRRVGIARTLHLRPLQMRQLHAAWTREVRAARTREVHAA